MSEGVQIKKRGRPKKAVPATDIPLDIATEVSSSTLKKSVSTKKGAADGIPNIQDVPAKKSRRKTIKSTPTPDNASLSSAKVIGSSPTPILVTNTPTSAQVPDDHVEVEGHSVTSESASDISLPMRPTPALSISSTAEPTPEPLVSETVKAQTEAIQPEPVQSSTASDHQRSSFLSSFLDKDYTEEAPSVTESAKISDRSAFKQQRISFEDIVKGDGVSTVSSSKSDVPGPSPILASLSSSPKPNTTAATEATSFAPLKIQSFPDPRQSSAAPATKPRLNIPPESFPSRSFMAFKESASLQARAKPGPVKPAPPAPSTTSQFRRTPEPTAQSPAPGKPEYTKMSYDQIKKLPEYRAKRWFWTKMMVGIPFSLVAGYALWGRLQAWQEQRRAALSMEGSGPRQRGVLHSKSPNVGANGSI